MNPNVEVLTPEGNRSCHSKLPLACFCPKLFTLLVHVCRIRPWHSLNAIFIAAQEASTQTGLALQRDCFGCSHQLRAETIGRPKNSDERIVAECWDQGKRGVHLGVGFVRGQ